MASAEHRDHLRAYDVHAALVRCISLFGRRSLNRSALAGLLFRPSPLVPEVWRTDSFSPLQSTGARRAPTQGWGAVNPARSPACKGHDAPTKPRAQAVNTAGPYATAAEGEDADAAGELGRLLTGYELRRGMTLGQRTLEERASPESQIASSFRSRSTREVFKQVSAEHRDQLRNAPVVCRAFRQLHLVVMHPLR